MTLSRKNRKLDGRNSWYSRGDRESANEGTAANDTAQLDMSASYMDSLLQCKCTHLPRAASAESIRLAD